ncbi:MAG: serine/threonine protein kinase, partial [Planctomycetes bacterium]|nr:serine/threonine protein kinase [Planctomycetota bacterium]
MSEKRENVDSILFEALRLPQAADRVAYLEAACGTGTALRAEVDSLLRAYEGPAGILKPPEGLLEEPADPVTEGPGTVIGRYKLLEKIGEGGMAVVYMAEQTEPIRRKVAL